MAERTIIGINIEKALREMDIGTRIKREFLKSKMPIEEFADRMCMCRSNIYYLFKREDVSTAILLKASQVLSHNFFEELSKAAEPKIRTYGI